MHKRKFCSFLICMLLILCTGNLYSQIYSQDFSTAVTTNPYTAPPQVLHPDLTNSSWAGSAANFTNLSGVLAMSSSAGSTITLTFDVASGKQLQIDSFNFWRVRSNSAPQNWAITINGINAGSGSIPTTGAPIGNTPVSNPVTGLTGTVTVVLTLTNTSGTGIFRIDNFVLNGSITTPCTGAVVNSIIPASGPADTQVTINGSGFQSGTTSVQFNGIDAAFTVVSDNSITATVPTGATSGNISLITNSCPATGPAFAVSTTNCMPSAGGTEIYISEVYDEESLSGGAIELFNPTGSTIAFNGNYVIQRYGSITDPAPSSGYIITLTGSIGPGMTYLIAGTNPNNCTINASVSFPAGFNGNDKFELLKNGVAIDIVQVPYSNPGYTLIRQSDAVAPSAVYNSNDWDNFDTEDCSTIGSHSALPSTPAAAIVSQPQNQSVCESDTVTFTVSTDNATGFSYQWKTLNSTGNWINVTNNSNYSGAATNTLTVSQVPSNFDGNQYYVEMSLGACTLISNAVSLTITPSPAVPTLILTQPTCITPTGTIAIDNPVAGLTYSIYGITGTTFSGLTPNTYTITVENIQGCTATTTATINAVPAAPAVPTLTVTQPTCSTPTGTIAIENPVAGLTYSINGTTGTIFSGLTPNTYTITVENAQGCTATTTATINAAPAAPAVPTLTVTQPTCITPTGTIAIDNPVAGVTYSINSTTGTTFSGLTPNTYTVIVENAQGCTATTTVTINAAPATPAVPTLTVTQPTCTIQTGTVTVSNPLPGVIYSINGTAGTTFSGLFSGTYTVVIQNTAGCTAQTTATINAAPLNPAEPGFTVIQPTCTTPTGSISINNPLAGSTYTINGITGTTFSGLTPNTYTITVENIQGCTATTTATINAVPAAPAVPTLTVTQPTCSTPTGTIAIENPVAGLTYSINGTTGTTFSGLIPNTYTVIAENAQGCTAATTATINAVPAAPAVPTLTVTQPTCSTPTGTIAIDNPIAGLTYSINGTTGTTFNGLEPGSYTVTVENFDGCISSSTPVVINAVGGSPQITTAQGCTAFSKEYILQVLPVNNSFNIDEADFEWRDANGVIVGNDASTFNLTQYVSHNGIDPAQFPLEFEVIVTSGGCVASSTFIVESSFCTVPKGISPNNDTLNDSFNLTGLNVLNLSVFNRYGKEVYYRANYSNEWHGQTDSGDELPTGTYYYVIELSSGKTESGWVYLNREE